MKLAMGRRTMHVRNILVPISFFLVSACTSPDVSAASEAELRFDGLSFLAGLHLFQQEQFGGNGRRCGDCHRLASAGDLAPEDVARAWRSDPTGPLFRSIDSDDGEGESYEILRRDATFRIPFVLPPGVEVEDPPAGSEHLVARDFPAPGQTTVYVRRSSPTVFNVSFEEQEAALMWDARIPTLEEQAVSAVETHAETFPGARPVALIASFQRRLFTSPELRAYASGGPAPTLPPGRSASERRGRGFFVSGFDGEHRGLCATCHAGPMLNRTDSFNPLQPSDERISNNFVSELNTRDPRLTYRMAHPVFGPVVLTSPDPGRLLTTGDPCELPAACVVNPGSTVSFFKISSLWGVTRTAPYFHDHSAATLEDVMDHYQVLFDVTVAGLDAQQPGLGEAFRLGPQDREDILAYMRYAF